jgi:hypothetical protein
MNVDMPDFQLASYHSYAVCSYQHSWPGEAEISRHLDAPAAAVTQPHMPLETALSG